jgi:ParB-like chromosome segregation protein Spo0J
MSTENKIPPLASKQLEPLLTPLSEIRPHPENYKIHNSDQIQVLRASLKAFGCTQPIKANLEGFIVAGHGMYQLYLEDGYTHAPVIYEALDKQLSKAYIVADNETARKAVTNDDQLSSLLQEISEIPDFDIEAVGFSLEDLDSLLGQSLNPDEFGEGFNLPSGDKEPFQQMTFTVADEQAELINECLSEAKKELDVDTFGNENGNGNALYKVFFEWSQLKT